MSARTPDGEDSARADARPSSVRALLRDPLGATALGILLLITVVGLTAPWITPHDPNAVVIDRISAPPDSVYILGGDGAGRDIFSRLLGASRYTLLGAMITVAVSLVIGVAAGLIAGYFGRGFDAVANGIAEALLALPAMIVLLALFRALGSSMPLTMAVFGVLLSPVFFRLVRGLVIGVRGELFVDAARVSGASDARIIVRHILRVIREPVIVQTSLVAGIAIILQSGLEFLGLGDPRIPTWGGMLQDAFDTIYVSPLSVLWPGGMIAITVGSLMLLANTVRDVLQQVPSAAARRPSDRIPAPTAAPAATPEGAILTVRGLRVEFGEGATATPVVRSMDLDLRRGEVLGLVGESGAGKSQTAFAVLGLLPPGGRVTAGSIVFDGDDLATMRKNEHRMLRGRRIGYVPQDPTNGLDPSFRIGFQLVEPLKLVMGLSAKRAKYTALELLARVGVRDPQRTFDAYPYEISGGMAQRVLIAGAISCEPDILIADEMTSALDVTVQAEVLDLLRSLQAEQGMGVLLITHDLGVAADLCDRVAVMRHGRVVEAGVAADLFAAPQHPYTGMLLRSARADGRRRPLRVAAGARP